MILVTLNHTYKNNFDVMDIPKGWGSPEILGPHFENL